MPVRGLDLALQGGHLVRHAGLRELFVQGELQLYQGEDPNRGG